MQSYEQYFDELNIIKSEKNRRVALAEKLEDVFSYLFEYLSILNTSYETSSSVIKKDIVGKYEDIVNEIIELDDYLDYYIVYVVDEIVDTTLRNIDKNDYWLSNKRAVNIAKEETNSIFNYVDYVEAKEENKTRKTWNCLYDGKTRETHLNAAGDTVDIDDVFVVGTSFLRFPRDTYYGANLEEILGCRCWVTYS